MGELFGRLKFQPQKPDWFDCCPKKTLLDESERAKVSDWPKYQLKKNGLARKPDWTRVVEEKHLIDWIPCLWNSHWTRARYQMYLIELRYYTMFSALILNLSPLLQTYKVNHKLILFHMTLPTVEGIKGAKSNKRTNKNIELIGINRTQKTWRTETVWELKLFFEKLIVEKNGKKLKRL